MSPPKPISENPPRWKPNPDPSSIVIPGLDAAASTIDQIEQIEQLITIKLQNIDETFSKIHKILANRLLPAVKRYAVGTEPVREAAKFWTSFYEQAAQIRIPTSDDHSTVNEMPSEGDGNLSSPAHSTTEDHPGDRTERPREVLETTVNSETSFMPGQGAVSSTPATARLVNPQDSVESHRSEDPSSSWTQSSLVTLSQELKFFSARPEDQMHTFPSSVDSIDDDSSTFQHDTTMTIPSSAKGKGKDASHPMLKSVLRHNLYSAADSSAFDNKLKVTSPLKIKPKTPVIDRSLNPYLPPSSSSETWSGVVDLSDPYVRTPQRRKGKEPAITWMKTPQWKDDTDEDSFDGLPPGMSPPILMSPVRPPKSSMERGLWKLRQTPVKEASERIQRDLIMSALKSVHKSGKKGGHLIWRREVVDSSMSTVPTPPSLSRYARRNDHSKASSSMTKDPGLESMARHIKEDLPLSGISVPPDGMPGLRLGSKAEQQFSNRSATPSTGPPPSSEPITPTYGALAHQLVDHSLDSDSDSLDSINNAAHPFAGFLMASGGAPVYDDGDSFGSFNHSSDSLENDDVEALGEGIVPVHPFAANAAVVDDGYDDDDDSSDGFEENPVGALVGGNIIDEFEEDTVFGPAPAQRQSSAYDGQNFRMLGEDLLQDTLGIGAQLAASGRVEESPTPVNWGR